MADTLGALCPNEEPARIVDPDAEGATEVWADIDVDIGGEAVAKGVLCGRSLMEET